MSTFLRQFSERFCALNKDNLSILSTLYAKDIQFIDPLHQINGLDALTAYFTQLYANVSSIKFEIHACDSVSASEGYLRWTMHFSHPKLRAGRTISVAGCTHLKWHDTVFYHRDFFDAGAMLYEQLPVFGSIIAWLKRRMAA